MASRVKIPVMFVEKTIAQQLRDMLASGKELMATLQFSDLANARKLFLKAGKRGYPSSQKRYKESLVEFFPHSKNELSSLVTKFLVPEKNTMVGCEVLVRTKIKKRQEGNPSSPEQEVSVRRGMILEEESGEEGSNQKVYVTLAGQDTYRSQWLSLCDRRLMPLNNHLQIRFELYAPCNEDVMSNLNDVKILDHRFERNCGTETEHFCCVTGFAESRKVSGSHNRRQPRRWVWIPDNVFKNMAKAEESIGIGKYKPGDSIEARWGKNYYKARVLRYNGDGTYKIAWMEEQCVSYSYEEFRLRRPLGPE